MSDKRIWLQPTCELDNSARCWSFEKLGPCEECGSPSIEYVRADIAAARIELLERALRDIVEKPVRSSLVPEPDMLKLAEEAIDGARRTFDREHDEWNSGWHAALDEINEALNAIRAALEASLVG